MVTAVLIVLRILVAVWVVAWLYFLLLVFLARTTEPTSSGRLLQDMVLRATRLRGAAKRYVGDRTEASACIAQLHDKDPAFDETAFLDHARRVLFLFATASGLGERAPLAQLATDEFWATVPGKSIDDRLRHAAKATFPSSAAILEFTCRRPTIVAGAIAAAGNDSLTVRATYHAVIGVGGDAARPAAHPRRIDVDPTFDCRFVRPADARTHADDASPSDHCASCGGGYKSDLDVACPYCNQPRRIGQGAWRLHDLSPYTLRPKRATPLEEHGQR